MHIIPTMKKHTISTYFILVVWVTFIEGRDQYNIFSLIASNYLIWGKMVSDNVLNRRKDRLHKSMFVL